MGIFYLKQVLDQFDGDVELALASYNAGPNRAADWKVDFYGLEKDEFIEEIPFKETRNYIRRILRSYGAYKAIYGNTAVAAPRNTPPPGIPALLRTPGRKIRQIRGLRFLSSLRRAHRNS